MEGPPPPGMDERRVARTVAGSWGLDLVGLHYEPKGFASYHWVGHSSDGRRWFVKLDGLEAKPYLGDDRVSALHGLEAGYTTARLLASAGLALVVAPVPTLDGRILVPLDDTWALTLFPFLEGETGEWGHPGPAERRRRLARGLADLHGVVPAAEWGVPRSGWELPGRAGLDTALAELGGPWSGGPYSEPARRALHQSLPLIERWLDRHDALVPEMSAADHDLVITHGEPHPGNVMAVDEQVRLIDWDTVALAPAGRDLWMLEGDPDSLRAYEQASGRAPDNTGMAFYRLTWALADLAAFTEGFRRAHDRNPVTEKSWNGLLGILGGSEPAPYGRREA